MGEIETREEIFVETVNAFVDMVTLTDPRVQEAIAESVAVVMMSGTSEKQRLEAFYKILDAKTAVLMEQLNNYKQGAQA